MTSLALVLLDNLAKEGAIKRDNTGFRWLKKFCPSRSFITLDRSLRPPPMFRHSRHIASALLAVLLLGTVIVPIVHDVHHVIEQLWPDEHGHVHPDYEALLDHSQHRLDTHIDCILCSTQITHDLDVADFNPILVKQPRSTIQNPELRVATSLLTVLLVRGPPVA